MKEKQFEWSVSFENNASQPIGEATGNSPKDVRFLLALDNNTCPLKEARSGILVTEIFKVPYRKSVTQQHMSLGRVPRNIFPWSWSTATKMVGNKSILAAQVRIEFV